MPATAPLIASGAPARGGELGVEDDDSTHAPLLITQGDEPPLPFNPPAKR